MQKRSYNQIANAIVQPLLITTFLCLLAFLSYVGNPGNTTTNNKTTFVPIHIKGKITSAAGSPLEGAGKENK